MRSALIAVGWFGLLSCSTARWEPAEVRPLSLDGAPVSMAHHAIQDPEMPSQDPPPAAPPSAPPAEEQDWRGNLNFLVGRRALDDAFWSPIEDQTAVAIELDMRPPSFPLGFEFGLSGSYARDDNAGGLPGLELQGAIGEIYAGGRFTVELFGFLNPYVAVGATYMLAVAEGTFGFSVDDNDGTVAGYVHGGAYATIADTFNLGVDVRQIFGSEVTLFGAAGDADYFQVALILGIAF